MLMKCATMMYNDNDDNGKKMDGVECDEMGWRGCNIDGEVRNKRGGGLFLANILFE
jgi:hypothetical protein